MSHLATSSPPRPPPSPHTCVSDPGLGSGPAKDANATDGGEDNKTSLTASAGPDRTETTTPKKRRTRLSGLWTRERSPVRTRSSTGSLPRAPKNPYLQTTPQRVEDVTPTKLRARPNITSAVRRSNPPRKCKRKSTPTGGARKRYRSSTPEAENFEDGVSDDRQAAEADGKDDGSDYENKVKTPGISDNGASKPDGFYGEQGTDAYAKPDESALRDGVKTPSANNAASNPSRYCSEQDSQAHAKPNVCGSKVGVRAPGIGNSGIELFGSGQSERPAENGFGIPVVVGSQGSIEAPDEGSTNSQAHGNGAQGFKEAKAAISNGKLRLGETNPTEYQVEDGPSVQNNHDGVDPKVEPALSPFKCHDKPIHLEAQEVAHPNQVPEVANLNAPSDIRFAMIVPTKYLAPEDFVANIKAFRFQSKSGSHPNVEHLFIYFGAPASQIQFVASISPVSIAPSPPGNDENGGTGPNSPDQPCVDYGVSSLWQLAEAIPLVKLQEAYGYEGPLTEPIEVSAEVLAAYPLAGMQRVL